MSAAARRVAMACAAAWLAGATACSSLPRQLAAPQVEVVELRLLRASFDGQRFAVRFLLHNPNAVPIPVRRAEFEVRLASEGLLEGYSVAPFTLPAGGSHAVDVEIFSNLVSSATRLLALVQGPSDSLEYELYGRVELDAALREPLGFYSRGQVPLVVDR